MQKKITVISTCNYMKFWILEIYCHLIGEANEQSWSGEAGDYSFINPTTRPHRCHTWTRTAGDEQTAC